MLSLGQAPSRFAGQIRKFGRGVAGAAHAVLASLLALARWIGRSVARLVTVAIPGLLAVEGRHSLAFFPRTRSLALRQTPARGKTVLVGGTVLVIAATFAAWGTLSNRDTFAPALPTPTPLPPNSVGITIVTNDTKAEWLGLVTEAFNKSAVKTSQGHQIVVQMIQESSPDPTVKKIVAGELPAHPLEPERHQLGRAGQPASEGSGPGRDRERGVPPIVYIPTGFAMWRPMAEALGWPDKPIGWKQIVELAGDPQGWAKYGHPEWGQFTFGHAHPEQSSTGFNILASLGLRGGRQDLRPDACGGQERRRGGCLQQVGEGYLPLRPVHPRPADADGTARPRVSARGVEQRDGLHQERGGPQERVALPLCFHLSVRRGLLER